MTAAVLAGLAGALAGFAWAVEVAVQKKVAAGQIVTGVVQLEVEI